MPSTRLLTAQKFISYFATLDKPLLESLLHESYHHEFAPKSITNLPGPLNKAGFLAHGGGLIDLMTGFPVYATEYIESESGNQVVVRATSKARFREEVKDEGIPAEEWEFAGEYVFMFTMDGSGEKIVRTVEFLDSIATMRMISLMQRASGNLAKAKAKQGEAALE
ncbi:hypothetical protein BJX70DRAFT_292308 [Aspergillus crustosus]